MTASGKSCSRIPHPVPADHVCRIPVHEARIVSVADTPARKTDVVEGLYEVSLHEGSSAAVAVKITDMLGRRGPGAAGPMRSAAPGNPSLPPGVIAP